MFQLSERLERLAQDFGTARDGLQLRSEVQQLMKELYDKIQTFNRECTHLENMVDRTDVSVCGRGEGEGQGNGGEKGGSDREGVLDDFNIGNMCIGWK